MNFETCVKIYYQKCEACLEYEAVHFKTHLWSTQSWTAGEKQIKFLVRQASYVVMLLIAVLPKALVKSTPCVLSLCFMFVVISSEISFSTFDSSHTGNTQLRIKHSVHSLLGFSAA